MYKASLGKIFEKADFVRSEKDLRQLRINRRRVHLEGEEEDLDFETDGVYYDRPPRTNTGQNARLDEGSASDLRNKLRVCEEVKYFFCIFNFFFKFNFKTFYLFCFVFKGQKETGKNVLLKSQFVNLIIIFKLFLKLEM